MKKALALLVALVMVCASAPAGASAAKPMPNSDPISHGRINQFTYLYWGKSEMYPVVAMVSPNDEFDVYEYDKDWVMVLYDTWVSQGMSGGSAQSFYCYVKRAYITCDPELEGDESAKADTGPGKRKGKKPNPKPTPGASSGATAGASAEPTSGGTAEPEPTVEEQEEYDWIIRTPGVCNVTMTVNEVECTCSFALMAQKAGGTAPSSDPAYNRGMHTPYAATAFFGMVATMQSLLENMNVSGFLTGTGGVEITGQAAAAVFYLDTGSADPALVSFTIPMEAVGIINPKITGDDISGYVESTVNMPLQLPVQLKKAGSGYQFVLPGMKPGGGDLTFPAVLEKAFADPDRFDKEAQDADKRREEAEKLRKKLLEKIKKQMQDEYNRNQQGAGEETSRTDPASVPGDNGEEVPLAPLVSEEPLAPLVSDEPLAPLVSDEPVAPLVSDDPLAPLTPSGDEEVHDFPAGNP